MTSTANINLGLCLHLPGVPLELQHLSQQTQVLLTVNQTIITELNSTYSEDVSTGAISKTFFSTESTKCVCWNFIDFPRSRFVCDHDDKTVTPLLPVTAFIILADVGEGYWVRALKAFTTLSTCRQNVH